MSEDNYRRALYERAILAAEYNARSGGDRGLTASEALCVCEALIEAHKDKARLTKLIDLGNHCDESWFSDHVWDLAEACEVPEEHADDPQYIIRAVIDREMEP